MKIFKYIACLLVFLACKNKEFTGVDNPVEEDRIEGTRVVFNDIGGYTIEEDSLEGKGLSTSYLGSIYDPVYGRTDASFYMNFEIEGGQSNVSIPANSKIDSIVLYFRYANVNYIDTEGTQKFKITVNEVDEKLTSSTKFNTKTKLLTSTVDLVKSADDVFKLAQKRVIKIGDTVISYLKIKLDTTIWTKIKSNLTSSDALQSAFKGLYITTENSPYISGEKGGIATLSLSDTKAGLYCFFHELDSTKVKQLLLTSITSSSFVFNRYLPIYNLSSGTNPAKTFDLSDSVNPIQVNKRIYLQGFGGYAAKLNLSGYSKNANPSFSLPFANNAARYFDSIRNLGGQIAINRALLILKRDLSVSTMNFDRPTSLFMTAFDSTGKDVLLQETSLDVSGTYLNGTYDDIKEGYVFNLTQTMQKLVNRKLRLKGLKLVILRANRVPNRVVIDLDAKSTQKPILEVYYTRLQ